MATQNIKKSGISEDAGEGAGSVINKPLYTEEVYDEILNKLTSLNLDEYNFTEQEEAIISSCSILSYRYYYGPLRIISLKHYYVCSQNCYCQQELKSFFSK